MFDLSRAGALLAVGPWQTLGKERIRDQACPARRADDQPAFTLTGSP